MTRAVDSAIGLPSRSTNALSMLAFLMPADVRRSLMLPPGWMVFSGQTARQFVTHRLDRVASDGALHPGRDRGVLRALHDGRTARAVRPSRRRDQGDPDRAPDDGRRRRGRLPF